MNKKYIICKSEEFKDILDHSKSNKSNYFIIRYKSNKNNYNRYGISVGKKIGNAVIRNRTKRRIKDILSKNMVNNSKDYVIIVRKAILDLSYQEMTKKLLKQIEELN